MKRLFFVVFQLMFSGMLFAQGPLQLNDSVKSVSPAILPGVHVTRDARLDKMLNWHIQKNTRMNGTEGFRVEIFFSSEYDALEKAKKKKVEFLSLYPDIPVHIIYVAPNFRVRVGDFRTKNEALKLYHKIKKDYPVAFVVTDNIDFPLLKQEPYERAD